MPTINYETVRTELVRRIQNDGLPATVRALGVPEGTVARIACGGAARKATLFLLASALGLVQPATPASPPQP